MSEFTITIAAARVNAKKTQEDIAMALHVSKQTVGSWENGRTSPMMDQAIRFCELCEVPYDRVSFLRERNVI